VTTAYCDPANPNQSEHCTKTTVAKGKNWKAAESTTVGKKDLTKQSAFSAKLKGNNSEANVAGANKHQVKILGG